MSNQSEKAPATPTVAPLGGLNLLLSTLAAMLVAGLILVTWVLPAEYRIDPLGTGARLGLTQLATPQTASHSVQSKRLGGDELSFVLPPFASVEYKYALDEGDALVYAWQADGELVFDLHSEREGSDPEAAVSFDVGRSPASAGAYTAPFTGKHGWFWENRTESTVTVSLRAHGFFTTAFRYEGGFVNEVSVD